MGSGASKKTKKDGVKQPKGEVDHPKESKENEVNIRDLLYNLDDLPLAQPGTDHLPDIVRETGFKAIDHLASIVLSTFDDNGRGVNLQGAETESLQKFIGLPRGVTDRLEFDEFLDVSSFVSEVVRLIKLNTVLVGFAAIWWETQKINDHTIQLTVEEREELRLSVFWCFLLHVVCKKVMFQPRGVENCLMEQLVSVFTKKRTEVRKRFKKCSGSFGTMKGLHTHIMIHHCMCMHARACTPARKLIACACTYPCISNPSNNSVGSG